MYVLLYSPLSCGRLHYKYHYTKATSCRTSKSVLVQGLSYSQSTILLDRWSTHPSGFYHTKFRKTGGFLDIYGRPSCNSPYVVYIFTSFYMSVYTYLSCISFVKWHEYNGNGNDEYKPYLAWPLFLKGIWLQRRFKVLYTTGSIPHSIITMMTIMMNTMMFNMIITIIIMMILIIIVY